jgi:hypothetical protein
MLIGMVRDLNPDVIVVRALVAGVVIGAIAGVLTRVLTSISHEE